jgi:hypothetical protein
MTFMGDEQSHPDCGRSSGFLNPFKNGQIAVRRFILKFKPDDTRVDNAMRVTLDHTNPRVVGINVEIRDCSRRFPGFNEAPQGITQASSGLNIKDITPIVEALPRGLSGWV